MTKQLSLLLAYSFILSPPLPSSLDGKIVLMVRKDEVWDHGFVQSHRSFNVLTHLVVFCQQRALAFFRFEYKFLGSRVALIYLHAI